MLNDITLAIRRLLRTPAFTLVAVATLAIGIGATTSIFSLINAIRLRPLPFAEPSRLFDVYEHNPVEVCAGCGVGTSVANFNDWRTQAQSFSGMAAYREGPAVLGFADASEKRRVARVSAGLFNVLGVSPARGRVFTADEDRLGSARVAVIGDALWRTQFHADENVVGTTVRIDGEPHQIIGVMPAYFAFPAFADLWLPLGADAPAARNERDVGVVARLAPGATARGAAAEMTTISARLETEYPAEQKGWTAHVQSLHEDLARDYVSGFVLMLIAVASVLLIACANLANLMLARAIARRPELAVRAALGASRGRLARQFLIEAGVLALAGGAAGLVLADWGLHALPWIKDLAGEGFPQWIQYEMDVRVYAFALGVSLLSGLAFGALASRFAASTNLSDVLKEGGRGSTGGHARTRNVLVVMQVATALVLVIVGGLMAKAMARNSSDDLGYETRGLMRANIELTGRRYADPTSLGAFADQLTTELSRSAGVASSGLMGLYVVNWPGTPHEDVIPEGHTADDGARAIHHIQNVTPAYFDALGAPLVAGRAFTESDRSGAIPVAIINTSLAGTLWPGASALGKRIRVGTTDWTIVGVAPDFRSAFTSGTRPLVYLPFAQHPAMQPGGQPLSLYVRAAPGATELPGVIRAAVQRIDRDVATNTIMSEDAFMRRLRSPYQAMAGLAVALAAFASLLAALGIYGVIAYFVGNRTHEIGVRMALGAAPVNIVRLVVRYGLTLGAIGIGVGIVGALAVTRLLGYLLFGVSATDPAVFGLVAVGFLGVAVLAAYLPARRATRVDPMIALRSE